jgi:hypothetical protein
VVWAVSGLLLVRACLRLVGRLVLGLRRPAELTVSPDGVTVTSKTLLLGRTVRRAEVVVPATQLARAEREVRYPRLPIYAGLLALCAGSYLGISLFVDGARAGSPSLLGLGVLLIGVGVLVDLVLSVLLPARGGRMRLVLTPRKGKRLALLTTDEAAASASLQRLARS